MVEVSGMNIPIGGAVSGILDIGLYVFVFAIFAGILFMVWNMTSYNITFIVRSLAKNRKIIMMTKAKVVKSKEGLRYLKVKGYKDLRAPTPPAEAVELKKNGKKFVEAYLTTNDEFIYITDTNDVIPSFQPLTSSQRVMAVNQLFKSKQDAGFSWKENIPLIAGGMILVMLTALLLISWESVWKPMEESTDKFAGIVDNMAKITERQYQISTGKQIIKDEPIQGDPAVAGGG